MGQFDESKDGQSGGLEPGRSAARPRTRYRQRGQSPANTQLLAQSDGTQRQQRTNAASNANFPADTSNSSKKRVVGAGVALLVLAAAGFGYVNWSSDSTVTPPIATLQPTPTADVVPTPTDTVSEPVTAANATSAPVSAVPPTQLGTPVTDTYPEVAANLQPEVSPQLRPVLPAPAVAAEPVTVTDPPPASVLPAFEVQFGEPTLDASPQIAQNAAEEIARADRPALTEPNAAPVPVTCTDCQSVNPYIQDVLLNIHTSPNTTAQNLAVFTEKARIAGVTNITPIEGEIAVTYNQIRFYHEGDAGTAQALANRFDATVVDFKWFSPKPSVGTVDLFLAGS